MAWRSTIRAPESGPAAARSPRCACAATPSSSESRAESVGADHGRGAAIGECAGMATVVQRPRHVEPGDVALDALGADVDLQRELLAGLERDAGVGRGAGVGV